MDASDAAIGLANRQGPVHVRISQVTKDFRLPKGNVLRALEDVSLDVGQSEFVALVGPSGCGKSTLLRLIAGLDTPTAGTVTIDNRQPADIAKKHQLGVVFQQHTLLPWLTVRSNVELPFKVAGIPVDHDRVQNLLSTVNMERFTDLRPRQLSGGMCQRVGIARALALKPAVLLLDEPFGAIDAVARKRLNVELQGIWQRNRVTAILVTHSVDEAVFLADRVFVLSSRPGRLLAEISVKFPRPREVLLFRDSAFNDITAEIEQRLVVDDYVDDR
jgi:NitT/TauT family transport system ATP-binding protein